MADVPSILIIGNASSQGADTGDGYRQVGLYGLTESLAPESSPRAMGEDVDVLRVFPDGKDEDPTAATPSGRSSSVSMGFYPWYDAAQEDAEVAASQHVIAASPAPTATRIYAATNPGWTDDEHIGRWVTVLQGVSNLGVGIYGRWSITDNGEDWVEVANWDAYGTRGNPGGATPAAAQGFVIGVGCWTDYHPCAGWTNNDEVTAGRASYRGGSSVAQRDRGIGYEAGMFRRLFDRLWGTNPWFHIQKFVSTGLVVGEFGTASTTQRTDAEAEMTRANAAFTRLGTGDTQVYTDIIIDLSLGDVLDWVANPLNAVSYVAALQSMITWARGSTMANNSTAHVHLISHDPEVRYSTSTEAGAVFARAAHRTVAVADANASVVDLTGLARRTSNLSGTGNLPASDTEFYAPFEYWTGISERIVRSIENRVAGTSTSNSGSLPTYIMVGDSIGVGQMGKSFSDALSSETLVGTGRAATQMIWDDELRQIVTYEPFDAAGLTGNSNTSGSTNLTAGPDFSLMHELALRHPDGFLLIKRCSSGSAMATEVSTYSSGVGGYWLKGVSGQHYEELLRMVPEAMAYARNTLNRQCDLRAIISILGTNDATTSLGSGDSFVSNLGGFVDDLRADFQTRSSGTLPILWRQPMLGLTGRSGEFTAQIRTALLAKAQDDPEFFLYNVDDADLDDGLHETAAFAITHGERVAERMTTEAI